MISRQVASWEVSKWELPRSNRECLCIATVWVFCCRVSDQWALTLLSLPSWAGAQTEIWCVFNNSLSTEHNWQSLILKETLTRTSYNISWWIVSPDGSDIWSHQAASVRWSQVLSGRLCRAKAAAAFLGLIGRAITRRRTSLSRFLSAKFFLLLFLLPSPASRPCALLRTLSHSNKPWKGHTIATATQMHDVFEQDPNGSVVSLACYPEGIIFMRENRKQSGIQFWAI